MTPTGSDVLETVGDFEIRRCCSEGHLFLEQISTGEGTEVPAQEIYAILSLAASLREAQLAQCFERHF
jgi:hypothetical protein